MYAYWLLGIGQHSKMVVVVLVENVYKCGGIYTVDGILNIKWSEYYMRMYTASHRTVQITKWYFVRLYFTERKGQSGKKECAC